MSSSSVSSSSQPAGPSNIFGLIAEHLPQKKIYIDTCNGHLEQPSDALLHSIFDGLDQGQKRDAYRLRLELAKREDPTAQDESWMETHFWDEPQKVAKVLHRLGLFGSDGMIEISYNLEISFELSALANEAPPTSFYYSLNEKWGHEPENGRISYVNGMGTDPINAGTDCNRLSDLFAEGSNIHAVYLPTQQKTPFGDIRGFACDSLRYLMIEGGGYTRTACLIAQQWIDYLSESPEKNFLQVGYSEGAAHVNAALRILRKARPDLIPQLNILTFCPASIIFPLADEPLKVINLFKLEDPIPVQWGQWDQMSQSASPHVHIVPHTNEEFPHTHITPDYIKAGKIYFDRFLSSGSLLSPEVEKRDRTGSPIKTPQAKRQRAD